MFTTLSPAETMVDLVHTAEVAINRATVAARFAADDPITRNIGSAEVVIVPRDVPEIGTVFAAHTRDFYRMLRREWRHPEGVEVASHDADFQELVQHADLWVLPTILLAEPTLGPMLINIVSNFIYDGIRRFRIPKAVEVESELLMETADGSLTFRYKGPADTYQKVMTEAVATRLNLLRREGKQ